MAAEFFFCGLFCFFIRAFPAPMYFPLPVRLDRFLNGNTFGQYRSGEFLLPR